MPEKRNPDSGWTLWKEIIGTAVAIAPFAVMFALWMASITTRVSVLEMQQVAQKATDDRQDADRLEIMRRIEGRLTEIERYLRETRK